jgi:tol-pal system protein YbgF
MRFENGFRIFVPCVIVILAGCASQIKQTGNQAILPEIDVVQVKENSDQALKLAQEAKMDVEVLSTKLTDLDNKQILLSEEVSNISAAKMEELENRITLLTEAFKDLQAQVTAIQQNPVRVISSVKQKPSDPTFSPSTASSLITSNEYELYQKGLNLFNSRNYKESIKAFNDCIAQYPSGDYPDNSYYWIGECFYGQGDFASAIASFQKVFSFQNSSKGDDAQFKIGLSYMKMGKQDLAQSELQKLIDRYPASEYVPKAKNYLNQIKQ